jgi:sec-independent protein translocase protein TatA
MGGISIWQLAIVGILVVLLFGRGKISELMGDVAKGIKSFKKGMKDDETITAEGPADGKIETAKSEPIDVTPKKEGESAS